MTSQWLSRKPLLGTRKLVSFISSHGLSASTLVTRVMDLNSDEDQQTTNTGTSETVNDPTQHNVGVLSPQHSDIHIHPVVQPSLILTGLDDDYMTSSHHSMTSTNYDAGCTRSRTYLSPCRSKWLQHKHKQKWWISPTSLGSGGSSSGIFLCQSLCDLHRTRSTFNLDLLSEPQAAAPPPLKVIDPKKERNDFRKRLQQHPETIVAMPCLPRFVSGLEVEYVYTRNDEIETPMLAGIGQYGCVYVARHMPSGQILTIKLLSSDGATIYDLALEASISQHLEVTTVVPNFWGIGMIEHDDRYLRYCLIQEYVGSVRTLEGYDINLLITNNRLGQYFHNCIPQFNSVDWTALCCRIVMAMNTIHEMGVVINDLKGDNILVRFQGTTNHIFFIDFGMARYTSDLSVDFGIQTDDERENFLKYFFLTAPEIIYMGRCYEASDVFSLGWLLATISISCNLPQLQGIINWCLHPLPHLRPNAKQLLQATKEVFYDAICRKMLLSQPEYLRSQIWKFYALSPDAFYI